MVVNPEVMYLSDNFLTVDRLLLVQHIFREENMVEQRVFSR